MKAVIKIQIMMHLEADKPGEDAEAMKYQLSAPVEGGRSFENMEDAERTVRSIRQATEQVLINHWAWGHKP